MRSCFAPLFVIALVFLPACRDAKVESYRTPHEQPEPLPPILTGGVAPSSSNGTASPGPTMADAAVPTAEGESLTWTAPDHWKPKLVSAMRKGSYDVPGEAGATADLSITAFPGAVGGELANINRWRGQLELPAIDESDIASATTRLDQNGLAFIVVDFVSAKPANPPRILGALVPFGSTTWFIKLMGPDATVAREKTVFLDFLKTVKPPVTAAP